MEAEIEEANRTKQSKEKQEEDDKTRRNQR
jgi:hypothetical protein